MSLTLANKEWMKAVMLSPEYIMGVRSFIKFTQESLGKEYDWYYCPCVKCRNSEKKTADNVFEHLICNGVDKSYTSWIHHGESVSRSGINYRNVSSSTNIHEDDMFPRMEDMVNDSLGRIHPNDLNACLDEVQDEDGVEVIYNAQEDIKYKKLMKDALQPLYPFCQSEHSKLSVTIKG
ncbi:hypothetical protein AQUCO_04600036v1 [Aquilegia coerulea]|uniref:Transposase-associated domain-containing protein n=1 Tax=Aquilegia coerulea TaxID=218851 RepID=A0A2G5CLH1_AQUCA|nr:hypothetical protein AQUCO_04600036v1 [Aquilegia coerulea]